MKTTGLLVAGLVLLAGCVNQDRVAENPYDFCKEQVLGPTRAIDDCVQSYVESLCSKQGLNRRSDAFAQCTRDLHQAALVRSQLETFRLPR